jgi:hypothetical protein
VSFLAPEFFAAGVAAALGVVALHFIVMRQPPSAVYPTARFIPIGPAVARTVARVPDDLLLLLLRVVALLLIGAAFARPVFHPRGAALLRIVVADRSRAVADEREVGDSVRAILSLAGGGPSIVVLFDSATRTVELGGLDSLVGAHRSDARASVSSALIAALRAATRGRERADSVELTVVSPLIVEEVDAATDSIRALWPGSVRLVRVAARGDSSAGTRPTINWPPDGHAPGSSARGVVDTVGAVVAGNVVVVAPFERRWRIDTSGTSWRGERVLARWVDGEPSAVERVSGAGCEHDVVVPIPTDGDLALRPEFRRFVESIDASCGRDGVPEGRLPVMWAPDSARSWRVTTHRLAGEESARLRVVAWLLVAAAGALVIEPMLRGWRRTRGAGA